MFFFSPSLSHSLADQKVYIPAFDIQALLPKDLRRYYRYNGSLTTPPCHQGVTWTLFHERVQISKAQVKKPPSSGGPEPNKMLSYMYISYTEFRIFQKPRVKWRLVLFPQLLKMETTLYSSKVTDADKMLLQDNYRSIQPLNRRIVLTSFSAGKTGSVRRKTEERPAERQTQHPLDLL